VHLALALALLVVQAPALALLVQLDVVSLRLQPNSCTGAKISMECVEINRIAKK
jgi:hypothetical protein